MESKNEYGFQPRTINGASRKEITTMGNEHSIKPAANFKQVTGSNLERRMPNRDAPAI
jgi:hypothetical protein